MRVMDTDSIFYLTQFPEKCLQKAEKEKNRKYLRAFLQKCLPFYPFFVYMDSLLGVEEEATLKIIQPYFRMCGYKKSRVALTLARATRNFICISLVPAIKISVQQSQWEDSSGLHLFQ